MANSLSSVGESKSSVLLVTSAEEAINLTRATEIYQFDTFITAALQGLQTAKPVLDRFAKISNITSLIALCVSKDFSPISVAGLDATEMTEASLREFFNKDGPVLGKNIDEARNNISELNKVGVYINVFFQIPVLSEEDRKDGGPKVRTLTWLDMENIGNIFSLPNQENSNYPGAVGSVEILKNSAGKIIQETHHTVFIGYSNLRVSLSSLSDGLETLRKMVAEAVQQVALELRFAQKAATQADQKQEMANVFNKNQSQLVDKIELANAELVESSLRLIHLLQRERQFLLLRHESHEDKESHVIERAKILFRQRENLIQHPIEINSRIVNKFSTSQVEPMFSNLQNMQGDNFRSTDQEEVELNGENLKEATIFKLQSSERIKRPDVQPIDLEERGPQNLLMNAEIMLYDKFKNKGAV